MNEGEFLFDPGPRHVPAKRPKANPPIELAREHADQLINSLGQRGLTWDDEGRLSRVVHLHSADKAYFAHYYADIVGTAMKMKWRLWWVELFAGPGRLFVADDGRFVRGSPLSALEIRDRFDGYVFADLDPDCVRSLAERVAGQPNVHVLQGDANSAELHDTVAAIVPRDALVVLYLDPEGLDLKFPTLRYFADRYRHLDFLLNFSARGVIRALRAGQPGKAGAVLNHSQPTQLITGSNSTWGVSVREYFQRQLESLGYDQFVPKVIRSYSRNTEQYDLLLASRNPLAAEFFQEATKREPGGQYTLDVG